MTGDDLLVAGTFGAFLFIVVVLVDGATRPGYRPTYHPVSALALGRRGWVQTANFVACGALITASAIGMLRADVSGSLAAAVAVFGLCLTASGVFPMDPMRGYPPGAPTGTPTTTSRRHQLHDWAGIGVFASLPVAALTAALSLDDTGWAIYAGLTAVASTVGLLTFGTAWEQDHPRAGLFQRITIVIGWTWLGATCWYLAT